MLVAGKSRGAYIIYVINCAMLVFFRDMSVAGGPGESALLNHGLSSETTLNTLCSK